MARNRPKDLPATPHEAHIRGKIEKLRALRLEDITARQAAGTWGEMSVWEITHQPTGEIFIPLWKGRTAPELAGLPGKRTAAKWAAEHQLLTNWLLRHRLAGFEVAMIAWDLSEAEARRTQQARIAACQADGRIVTNLSV